MQLWTKVKRFFKRNNFYASIEISGDPAIFIVFPSKSQDEVERIIEQIEATRGTSREVFIEAEKVLISDVIIP